MKKSYIFLAEGFEEIEALTAIDVLRRAGMDINIISISDSTLVTGAHGIIVKADAVYTGTVFNEPEWLILPGGLPGADNLHDYLPLIDLLRHQLDSPSGRIAAICAAPAVVLGTEGMLKGRKATCYPGFEGKLEGAEYVDAPVVSDSKFVLGAGPGTAMEWALTIVKATVGAEKAREVAAAMLYKFD